MTVTVTTRTTITVKPIKSPASPQTYSFYHINIITLLIYYTRTIILFKENFHKNLSERLFVKKTIGKKMGKIVYSRLKLIKANE